MDLSAIESSLNAYLIVVIRSSFLEKIACSINRLVHLQTTGIVCLLVLVAALFQGVILGAGGGRHS